MGPLDAEFFDEDQVRAALAARDLGTLYRLLGRLGMSQRRIAQLTSQSQSEVCEIIKGRQVRDVWVLERIADGLGVPRAWMGLSYGEHRPDAPSRQTGVDEEMTRRVLLAATSTAVLGQAFQGLGEPIELALPTSQVLPSRLGMSQVRIVRAVTEQLRGLARYYGGHAELLGAAVRLYTRWLRVPATETVTAGLGAALAELHTEAGWACYDSGMEGTAYFTRALGLAQQAGDVYGIANAAWHAGMVLTRTGQPHDALKLFQLAQLHLRRSQPGRSTPATPPADDPRLPTLTARLARSSAVAYARMGGPDQAHHYLTQARDGWEPPDPFERANADLATAVIHRELGQLEAAAQFATSAGSTYTQHHRRGRTLTELLLAELHLRTGEPQGLTLAHHAIENVSTLHSLAARREWLLPLATALHTRPGADSHELAQKAQQIATTPT